MVGGRCSGFMGGGLFDFDRENSFTRDSQVVGVAESACIKNERTRSPWAPTRSRREASSTSATLGHPCCFWSCGSVQVQLRLKSRQAEHGSRYSCGTRSVWSSWKMSNIQRGYMPLCLARYHPTDTRPTSGEVGATTGE